MPKETPWFERLERKFVAHRSPGDHVAVARALDGFPADHQECLAFVEGVETIAA
jgi:hypothetical protein